MTTPAPAFSQHQHALLQTAMAVLAAGVSLVPVSATTKQPVAALLPTDRDGKSSWKVFQSRLPLPDELLFWIQSNAQLAVVAGLISGGLMVLDFDEPRFFDAFKQQIDITPFPVQQTGGGGYQLMFRCPQPKHNLKLAWVADSTEPEGRRIAIETRGEGGYAVIAPSLHPSGNHYTMLQGSLGAIPLITQAEAEQLLEAASQLDEMPYTAKQLHAMNQAMQQPQQQSLGTSSNVIEQFNQATSIETELANAGYTQTYNNRWQRPGGSSGSVIIKQGKSFHHSSNDPLSDGFWHDPFDIWCYYTHRGDAKQAVKEAAILLCIPMPTPQPTPIPSQPSASPSAASTPAPTQAFHPILLSAPMTDLGNAECLAAMKGDQLRYCRTSASWFTWSGQHWEIDKDAKAWQAYWEVMRWRQQASIHIPDPKQAMALADYSKRRGENDTGIKAGLNVAKNLPIFNTTITDYDRNDWLLGVRNGVIELQTQTFRPAQQADMMTMQASTDYNPSADCPRWKQFLVEVFNNDTEVIRYIQRVVGYCLTGNTKEQKMFLFFGDGANGKSIFLATIAHVFGDYGYGAPFTSFDADRRSEQSNDLAMFRGKRLVTVIETPADKRLDEARVKSVTGGDQITCRFLHKEFFSYWPNFKLIMATNYLPVIRNMDRGIWRRLEPIPFNQNFEDRMDDGLKEKLQAEAAGILNWALEGLVDWLANGLGTAKVIEDSKQAYRGVSDVVGQFLDENYITTKSPHDFIPSKALYKHFEQWSFDRGEKAMTSTSFGRILAGKGYISERKVIASSKVTVYLGLRERLPTDT